MEELDYSMISYNQKSFVIGKEEYPPYAAELHYFRIQKRYWSICFERIRKAGFKIISTVVPWNLHEDDNREFDFSGFSDPTRDLIVFVELVREFGFKLILRPGPWLFSECYMNGLPKFLEKYPEIFARTKDGEMIRSVNRADVAAAYYPSIGNPRYMSFVRHYLNGLTEIIKNYVYPRGPLFLLELDYENYFGGHFEPHLTDYNEHVVKEIYPSWLNTRYGDIKGLNKVYSAKYKDFSEVEPPVEFSALNPKAKACEFDWFRFKEHLMDNYVSELREMYKTFSCEPMFFKSMSFKGNIQSALSSSRMPVEGCLSTVSISWDLRTSENLSRVRKLRTVSELPYVAELPVGNWSYNPERSRQYYPIGADATRYIITAGLAGGMKGFTYSMFADHDHWYGAALGTDGTIQDSYDLIKSFNLNAQAHEISSFEPVDRIGLVMYRPYAWESLASHNFEAPNLARYLATETMPKLAKDLDILKHDFSIPDLSIPASVERFDTLVIPVSDVMDENEQAFIIELAKKGKNIILVGTLPQHNTSMQSCTVLASALKCKNTSELKFGHVVAEGEEFTTVVFGALKTTERRSRRLATADRKTVAISFSKFKGAVILISFDLCTETNHHKMAFLDHILQTCKLQRYVETSNPSIRAVVRRREKGVLLCLMNSSPQLPFKEVASGTTRTAIKVDLKKLGLKSARIKMTELFTDEVINTTAQELAKGLYLTLSAFDGRVYLITRR